MAGSAASLMWLHADPKEVGLAHVHADGIEVYQGHIMQVLSEKKIRAHTYYLTATSEGCNLSKLVQARD
jgi:hypothetical protein